MQESHLANCIRGFSEPKKGEKLLEMAAEAQIPPGSALPEHSPGLMRYETPAVFRHTRLYPGVCRGVQVYTVIGVCVVYIQVCAEVCGCIQ